MGKKKKKKKKKKNGYNKKEFLAIVCDQCRVCNTKKPSYCYEIVYKEWPDFFMQTIFPGLVGYRSWLDKAKSSVDSILISHFREMFCHSGICGPGHKMNCQHAYECFNAFRKQSTGLKVEDRRAVKSGPKILEAYPTFFMSENEDFRKEVEEILSDGNRDIEQDSSEGSTISSAG